MKNVILAFIGIFITLYTVTIGFSIFSLETRKNELENQVSRIVENTLEQEYEAEDEEAVQQKLIEELSLDVGTNGTLDVEVLAMDLEKGIVSVRVTEHFRQFNGKERTIVCEKTAIVEQHMQKSITTEAVTKLQLKASQNNSTLSNAYEFYETYGGSKMVFEPGENREGMIYYGTRGKRAPTAKTRYENLGWQVTVKDSNGTVVEQIYYYIEGANMEKVDARDVDDYRYSLYCVSLENLKSRLSEEGCEALTHPDSSIIFDACITVVSNNVRQGGMSDSGISWGEVYTTYDGIVNARAWSDKTKEAMKSYYSKTVENMFYQVELICGDGITSVSGAGEYCYGTEVTIDAVPQSGYTFWKWVGNENTTSQKYTFTVYEDVTITATTTRDDLSIHLHRNLNAKDEETYTMSVPLTGASAVLPDMGWKKKGHYQTGWSTSRIVAQAYFGVGQVLAYDWLERVAPSVDLYATWSPNEYVIVYDGNGATGNIASDDVVYTDTMQLPVEGFKFRRGTLAGWSLTPDAVEPEYLCGQTIDVAELVQKLGLEYTSNATICLYAVKGPAAPIHIRFISESYYKDENGNWIAEEDGGLWDDSIWKIDSSYTNILDSLFGA